MNFYDDHISGLFNSHLLCTGSNSGPQGTCKGDSGGPLMWLDIGNNDFWST